jgi:hypothetical protein
MFALETVKRTVEKMTGLARPTGRDLQGFVRLRKPHIFHFYGRDGPLVHQW